MFQLCIDVSRNSIEILLWFKGSAVCLVCKTNHKEISLAGGEKYQIL